MFNPMKGIDMKAIGDMSAIGERLAHDMKVMREDINDLNRKQDEIIQAIVTVYTAMMVIDQNIRNISSGLNQGIKLESTKKPLIDMTIEKAEEY